MIWLWVSFGLPAVRPLLRSSSARRFPRASVSWRREKRWEYRRSYILLYTYNLNIKLERNEWGKIKKRKKKRFNFWPFKVQLSSSALALMNPLSHTKSPPPLQKPYKNHIIITPLYPHSIHSSTHPSPTQKVPSKSLNLNNYYNGKNHRRRNHTNPLHNNTCPLYGNHYGIFNKSA